MKRSGPVCLLVVLLLLTSYMPASADAKRHRFWPRFPRAQRVLLSEAPPSAEYAILLATLAGLSARTDTTNTPREVIWLPAAHPAYVRLLEEMAAQTGAKVDPPQGLWALMDHFRQRGIVQGYVLYRYDTSDRHIHADGAMDVSANVATSLCAPLHAVAVSEGLEAEARAHGLTRLLDARNLTEAAALDRYGDSFSRTVLATIDPKVPETRMEAVAMGAFVAAHPGPIYERALARLEPDSPVLGWGAGDESQQTAPSSRFAAFQTATNWCTNLPVLDTEEADVTYPADRLRPRNIRTIWDLAWEDDVHYVAFLMSDGDNVQWAMGNFLEPEESWWASPVRGTFPMGWTLPYVDLAQLSPYTLDQLYSTSKLNDDFTLLGGGYYYPELFGTSRKPGDYLAQHARRIGAYMRMGHVTTLMVNLQKWDGPEAMRAYHDYAASIPGLKGIFTVQYYPYTAGRGRVMWIRKPGDGEMPVISARYAIWAQTGRPYETAPTKVATMLNAEPHDGPMSEVRFSWVVAHAWSYFREPRPGDEPGSEEVDQSQAGEPGVVRGLLPVRWCVDALAPHVRVLTPSEFVRMMRLRLHPKETLGAAIRDLDRRIRRAHTKLASVSFTASKMTAMARQDLLEGRYREAFQQAREAYIILDAAGLAGPP